MRVVFDLDGTLANGDHREHFITTPNRKKDWDAFFAASGGDKPIPHVIETLRALWCHGTDIEIWSGRGEGPGGSVRSITEEWLDEHVALNIVTAPNGRERTWNRLRMRGHEDYTPDHSLKREWLEDARVAGTAPDLVFDDRAKVVAMWRAEGVPCFQVAPGDF